MHFFVAIVATTLCHSAISSRALMRLCGYGRHCHVCHPKYCLVVQLQRNTPPALDFFSCTRVFLGCFTACLRTPASLGRSSRSKHLASCEKAKSSSGWKFLYRHVVGIDAVWFTLFGAHHFIV